MNSVVYRTGALALHVLLNIVLVNYLVNFDPGASWVTFVLFILVLMILLAFFVKHLISFISFIKSESV